MLALYHMEDALQSALKNGHYKALMEAFSLAALILIHKDKVVRAVEFYEGAKQHPLISNSKWYQDVVGHHIDRASAALSSDCLLAAKKRGKQQDPRHAAQELLEELAVSN